MSNHIQYVAVKDNVNDNINLWEIRSECVLINSIFYVIRSRYTYSFVEKSKCYKKEDSTLFYCDEKVDIPDSMIDLDDYNDFCCYDCIHRWVCKECGTVNECLEFDDGEIEMEYNCDSTDMGYMEDVKVEEDTEMKAWQKAQDRFIGLTKVDIIHETCPDILGILPPPECCEFVRHGECCSECQECWEREVEE